ncbi:hypothetical protein CKO13_09055, partial [Halorhodospira neutriphila]|nr:hypothetical protein [Halorhodospira neutriphila]
MGRARRLPALLAGAALAALGAGCGGWQWIPHQGEAFSALREGDTAALEEALAAGAEADAGDRAGRTLLHHAAIQGRPEAL